MSSVAKMLGLPPGVHFQPDDDELVEFYLLPRARGEPAPFPGVVVVEDDAAGSTLPWELLDRHGRGADDEAYFFVRSSGNGDGQEKPGARQERGCGGGGTWKSQKRLAHGGSRVDDAGEMVQWSRHNLNLHMGRGESGGSVGWVMHEYALTDPSFPQLKICHVAFTGHGKNRKRLPGGDADGQNEEPASKRACVPAAGTGGSTSSSSGSATTTVDPDYSGIGRSSEEHQEPKQLSLEWISRELLNDDLQSSSFPSSVAQDYIFHEFAQAAAPRTEQQVPEHLMMTTPQPMVQETAGMVELQELMAPMDQQEFMAPLPMIQETAGMAELQELMAPMDQQEVMVPLPMVQETASTAELQEFIMAPMDQQQECMAPLLMVQQTAGMAVLENPYHQPMMTQPQQEFLAPMGFTVGDSCSSSHIGDMEAGAQQDVIEWDGFLFY